MVRPSASEQSIGGSENPNLLPITAHMKLLYRMARVRWSYGQSFSGTSVQVLSSSPMRFQNAGETFVATFFFVENRSGIPDDLLETIRADTFVVDTVIVNLLASKFVCHLLVFPRNSLTNTHEISRQRLSASPLVRLRLLHNILCRSYR